MKIYWDGKSKNIIGAKVHYFRKRDKLYQRALAEKLQLMGYAFSDLTILRIESGKRFVPDYEVKALALVFKVSYQDLLDD